MFMRPTPPQTEPGGQLMTTVDVAAVAAALMNVT